MGGRETYELPGQRGITAKIALGKTGPLKAAAKQGDFDAVIVANHRFTKDCSQ